MYDYILKTTVEDLQLRFAEVGLGFQLIKTLWPVTHHRHLQLVICFIYRERERETCIYYTESCQDFNNPCLTYALPDLWKQENCNTQERDNSAKLENVKSDQTAEKSACRGSSRIAQKKEKDGFLEELHVLDKLDFPLGVEGFY